jgi:hypothetical protein
VDDTKVGKSDKSRIKEVIRPAHHQNEYTITLIREMGAMLGN